MRERDRQTFLGGEKNIEKNQPALFLFFTNCYI